ncbi:MAG: protein-glutamate O-methyltransferase CheR [Pseudomonadota bacterium]
MNARELLQRASGLDLSEQVVERALRERMASCGVASSEQYLQQMSPAEMAALIELVVVPESWMFRDPGAFIAATAVVQQRLAAHPDRVVRILSIPCAGGEEPYSMAMALNDAGVAPGAFRIEGVDLSQVAVERARAGRYTRNAFRGGDVAFRERHFSRHGDEYQISDELRAQVGFAQANLLAFDSASAAARYDVVFCRNLLIYFDDATAAAAIGVLHALLADDGTLFAGYAEVPAFCRNGFASLRLPGAFALQKAHAAAVQAAPPRRPPRTATSEPAPRRAVTAPSPTLPPAAPAVAAADLLAAARRQADHGDYQGAAAACHALLAADPNSADAYFLLGMVSECQHKPGAADDYWRRCVYLQPDHYDALCHLALLAEHTGDAAQAAVFRQRAARIFERRGSVTQ